MGRDSYVPVEPAPAPSWTPTPVPGNPAPYANNPAPYAGGFVPAPGTPIPVPGKPARPPKAPKVPAGERPKVPNATLKHLMTALVALGLCIMMTGLTCWILFGSTKAKIAAVPEIRMIEEQTGLKTGDLAMDIVCNNVSGVEKQLQRAISSFQHNGMDAAMFGSISTNDVRQTVDMVRSQIRQDIGDLAWFGIQFMSYYIWYLLLGVLMVGGGIVGLILVKVKPSDIVRLWLWVYLIPVGLWLLVCIGFTIYGMSYVSSQVSEISRMFGNFSF